MIFSKRKTEKFVVSGDKLANIFSLTKRRVQQLAKDDIIKNVGRNSYDLENCVKGYIKYLKEVVGETNRENLIEKKVVLLEERIKKKQLENAELSKRVLKIDDVGQAIMQIVTVLKTQLLGLSGSLAINLVNKTSSEIKKIVDQQVRIKLNNASEQLQLLVGNDVEVVESSDTKKLPTMGC